MLYTELIIIHVTLIIKNNSCYVVNNNSCFGVNH